jgi:SAM-dependent methyltransferase
MTTLPEPPGAPRISRPHELRQAAESFGVDAARYDRTRPGYPRELIDAILAASPGRELLDVGCGTGISSRAFQAAGARVLGLDVDERMVEFARGSGVEAEVAKFEEWDPAGRVFDVVVAGQTWHWIDPEAGLAQAARVLRPRGRLALFWNVFAPPPEVGAAMSEVVGRVLPGSLASTVLRAGFGGGGALIAKLADDIASNAFGTNMFEKSVTWEFPWDKHYSRDEWLDQVPTQGLFTRLEPGQLTELLTGLGTALDELGGGFTMHHIATAVTAVRA